MWKRLLFAGLLLVTAFWVTSDSLFGVMQNHAREIVIPEFCGKDLETVDPGEEIELTVEYRYDEEIPAGIVTRQEPEAGSVRKVNERHPKCAVKLYVSLGRETE